MANCSSEWLILNKRAVPQTLLIIYNSIDSLSGLHDVPAGELYFSYFFLIILCLLKPSKQVIYLSHVWRHNMAMQYILPNISWRF